MHFEYFRLFYFIMEEIWKDIENYEGFYQVSNLGRVKSMERIVNAGAGGKRIVKERIMKQGYNQGGYLSATLSKNFISKTTSTQRLVAKAFIPNPENKAEVNHINCIRDDNRVSNLEWNTKSENIRHSFQFGKNRNNGENSNRALLTNLQVSEIRGKYTYGRNGCEKGSHIVDKKMICEEYNISINVLRPILSNKTYVDEKFIQPLSYNEKLKLRKLGNDIHVSESDLKQIREYLRK